MRTWARVFVAAGLVLASVAMTLPVSAAPPSGPAPAGGGSPLLGLGPQVVIASPGEGAPLYGPTVDVAIDVAPLLSGIPIIGRVTTGQVLLDGVVVAEQTFRPGIGTSRVVFPKVDLTRARQQGTPNTRLQARVFQAGLLGILLNTTSKPVTLHLQPADDALGRLQRASQAAVRATFGRGGVRALDVRVPLPTSAGDDPVEQALAFLEEHHVLFGLGPGTTSLYLERIEVADGETHVIFGQQLDGLPVIGSFLAVHLRGRLVTGTEAVLVPEAAPRHDTAILDEDSAVRIAGHRIGQVRPTVEGAPYLAWVDPALVDPTLDPAPRQVWRVRLLGTPTPELPDGGAVVIVDAQTGALVRSEATQEGSTPDKEYMVGPDTSSPTCDADDDELYADEDGHLDGWDTAAPADRAYTDQLIASYHRVYDFFHANYERHGWDDDDAEIGLNFEHNEAVGGASGDRHGCRELSFTRASTVEVVAHEFTHAVNTQTARMDSTSPMRESIPDVFGALVSRTWTQGGAIPPANWKDGSPRFLDDPPKGGLPDHESEVGREQPPPGGGPRPSWWFKPSHITDAHITGGVPDKAAWLTVEGDPGRELSTSVQEGSLVNKGIGWDKATLLYYALLTTRLSPSASRRDAANGAMAIARSWADNNLHGFTATDACSVRNAWARVGLATTEDRDCDGLLVGTDLDTDGDLIPDATDVCRSVRDWSQVDRDHDGQGDLCDDDLDGDTVPNLGDKCPTVVDFQSDWDVDGRGDLCDDDDHDGYLDLGADNCPTQRNDSQTDLDQDGEGDACDPDLDGDQIANEDDNCRSVANHQQADPDLDGFGDPDEPSSGCDTCPGLSNPDQADLDADGRGDACDDDADGDQILDADDQCPGRRDLGFDFDHDAVDIACDEDENDLLNGIEMDFEGSFRPEQIEDHLLLPFEPCVRKACGSYIGPDRRASVTLTVPGLRARISVIDGNGNVVTQQHGTGGTSISFRPRGGFHYRSPAGDTFEHGRYWLQVTPLPAAGGPVPTGDVPFRLQVDPA